MPRQDDPQHLLLRNVYDVFSIGVPKLLGAPKPGWRPEGGGTRRPQAREEPCDGQMLRSGSISGRSEGLEQLQIGVSELL